MGVQHQAKAQSRSPLNYLPDVLLECHASQIVACLPWASSNARHRLARGTRMQFFFVDLARWTSSFIPWPFCSIPLSRSFDFGYTFASSACFFGLVAFLSVKAICSLLGRLLRGHARGSRKALLCFRSGAGREKQQSTIRNTRPVNRMAVELKRCICRSNRLMNRKAVELKRCICR